MTVAAPESSGSPPGPDPTEEPDDDTVVVRRTVRERTAVRRRRRRRIVIAQAGVTALFAVLLVGLLLVGWSSALRITGGSDDAVTDPAAPGYVASVRPTPVTLIAFTADDVPTGEPEARARFEALDTGEAELASMALVVDGPVDTEVVPLSADTLLWEFEDAGAALAYEVFLTGGIDVLRLRLGSDLTFGATSAVELPVSAVEDIARQVGPVTLDLPDPVIAISPDGEEFVRYAAGPLTLQPEDVAEFLGFVGLREPGPNQALRSALLWSALIDAAAAAPGSIDPAAVGGALADDETAEGREALAAMFDGDVRVDPLPLEEVGLITVPPTSVYRIETASMSTWVSTHVPFPISAFPGQRARVAVLNGTTDEEVVAEISPSIVGAGGAITLTGNAESFAVTESRVNYARPDAVAAAESIAAALGLVATLDADLESDADVVVVVGADRASS